MGAGPGTDWGEAHLELLRRFSAFHSGIPCTGWLRVVMNRIDPGLFAECFTAWVAAAVPDKIDLVAIKPAPAKAGGKTSRRSHERAKGKLPPHLVSAYASHGHLVLGQPAAGEKANEIIAIPELIARIEVACALVRVDGRSYPGAPRFPQLATIAMAERTVEWRGEISRERSYMLSVIQPPSR